MVFEEQISTKQRVCFLDITQKVQKRMEQSGIVDGIVVVFVPHTTAGVTINENGDKDVRYDLEKALLDIVPNEGFLHFEGNSDAHTKTLLTGQSLTLIIQNSKLILGTWQSIYFAEYDGPRNRKFFIKIIEG